MALARSGSCRVRTGAAPGVAPGPTCSSRAASKGVARRPARSPAPCGRPPRRSRVHSCCLAVGGRTVEGRERAAYSTRHGPRPVAVSSRHDAGAAGAVSWCGPAAPRRIGGGKLSRMRSGGGPGSGWLKSTPCTARTCSLNHRSKDCSEAASFCMAPMGSPSSARMRSGPWGVCWRNQRSPVSPIRRWKSANSARRGPLHSAASCRSFSAPPGRQGSAIARLAIMTSWARRELLRAMRLDRINRGDARAHRRRCCGGAPQSPAARG